MTAAERNLESVRVLAKIVRAMERGTIPAWLQLTRYYGRITVAAISPHSTDVVDWLDRAFGPHTERIHRRPVRAYRSQYRDEVDCEWTSGETTIGVTVSRSHVCAGPFYGAVEKEKPVWRCRCGKKLGVRKAREMGLLL